MKTVLILCLFALSGSLAAMPNDSIGTKNMNGTSYIMHKVTKGEGVYGISRKYGVAAADIFAANEGSEKGIKIGQVLLIPKGKAPAGKSTGKSTGAAKSEKTYHVVASGQTLSSIAKMYQTSVAKIKELNNLKSDNIQLGQKLLVSEDKTEAPPTNSKTKEEPPARQDAGNTAKTEPKPGSTSPNVVVETDKIKDKPMADNAGAVNTSYSVDDGDEVNESGLAVISSEGDLSQERSFVMHPTAKVGTIVMITNTTNNNSVFARVIGNCKMDNGCVLKMSKTVAMKLGVTENISVKVSYAK